MDIFQTTKVLPYFDPRAIFGLDYQCANLLRHSFSKKLTKLALPDTKLLLEWIEKGRELSLELFDLLFAVMVSGPLLFEKFRPGDSLLDPGVDGFISARTSFGPSRLNQPGQRMLHRGNATLFFVADKGGIIGISGK